MPVTPHTLHAHVVNLAAQNAGTLPGSVGDLRRLPAAERWTLEFESPTAVSWGKADNGRWRMEAFPLPRMVVAGLRWRWEQWTGEQWGRDFKEWKGSRWLHWLRGRLPLLLLLGLLAVALPAHPAQSSGSRASAAEPPFAGTIFIDPDIITPATGPLSRASPTRARACARCSIAG